ncbi:hypothetical protein OSC52_09390 [Clostridium pasteurianum]|uniref:hypothetical protein n=1 Tax=Clostridium pasteurianum TaxID=1501 RepID=UPI002260B582|nr:hypothetical protein [Clostridium pasteurianum]UZW16009.1 hypothetical protein OSC52_09390 [Clostridium pasteurianum]
MSIKSDSSEIECGCMISNMSDELFNDALYYREMADSTEDFYLQWRYRRSAIISFCASAEAWMNSIIKNNLEKKAILENSNEQKLLSFIKDYNSKMPKGFNNVRNKLYNFIPKSINGKTINWKTDREKSFENYIQLSNMRNSVIHYAASSSTKVHSQEFIDLVKNADDIIESLFQRYSSLGNRIDVPSWYKNRQSRIIK